MLISRVHGDDVGESVVVHADLRVWCDRETSRLDVGAILLGIEEEDGAVGERCARDEAKTGTRVRRDRERPVN